MAKIKNNREFDTTVLIFGACILAGIAIIGLFVLHALSPENSLLSPEIVMAIIGIPGFFIQHALGKEAGRREAEADFRRNGGLE